MTLRYSSVPSRWFSSSLIHQGRPPKKPRLGVRGFPNPFGKGSVGAKVAGLLSESVLTGVSPGGKGAAGLLSNPAAGALVRCRVSAIAYPHLEDRRGKVSFDVSATCGARTHSRDVPERGVGSAGPTPRTSLGVPAIGVAR